MAELGVEDFRIAPGTAVDLSALPTRVKATRNARGLLRTAVEKFAELQEILFADGRHSLLLVFQGMDAAGKDSTIKNVTSGVNPQGFLISNFKKPTSREIEHTFLRRYWMALPERGRIGIFNRSHYEEVLIMRVHPELLDGRRLPDAAPTDAFWNQRLEDINAFEAHLSANGVRIAKFFLHLSRAEQRKRFLDRLADPSKHWKIDPADLSERDYWDDYQRAYEGALSQTSSEAAPWYWVPADHKPTMRLIVAQTIVDTLARMDIAYPQPSDERLAFIERATKHLG